MSGDLLQTKLYVPKRPNGRQRHALVPRPHLIEKLNEGLAAKLTLISAPAGFGKTTLIAEFIHHSPFSIHHSQFCWLSLDEHDNDLTRFLTYLVAALQTIQPDIGETAVSLLHSPQPPLIEAVMTTLINELDAAETGNYILVLDDYHLITNTAVHQALTFLIENMPPQLHLVIITRADPPLPLPRWRVRGQMNEIRQADLRFTVDEATAFLNEVMGLSLATAQVKMLEARTEGWIAGLQMAALSMKGKEDVGEFIAAFSGSQRFILDYLTEEVIQGLPDELQQFLLQTSILGRLRGSLCEAVTGQEQGWATLEKLEASNLFLIPLDEDRQWFRYHHLFAEMMVKRLHRLYGDQLPELHRRAAHWFEENGFAAEAVRHALSAEDYVYAAQLIERNAQSMLMRGELIALLNLIEAVEFAVQERPWLAVQSAWAFTYTGQLERIEPILQMAERCVLRQEPGRDAQEITGHIAAVRAYVAALNGDTSQTIEHAQEALKFLSKEDVAIRSVVAFALGGALQLKGEWEGSRNAWEKAGQDGRKAGNVYLAVSASSAQADISMDQGFLHLAAQTYHEALQLCARPNGRQLPVAARPLVGLGNLHYEWNDLENAARCANRCIDLCRMWGNPDTLIAGFLLLTLLNLAQGDLEQAKESMGEANLLKRKYSLRPGTAARIDTTQVRLWLVEGSRQLANHWAQEIGSKIRDHSSFLGLKEYIALGHVLLANNELESALDLATHKLKLAETNQHWKQVIELLIIQALVFQAKNQISQSLGVLQRTLQLAESEGYVRTFLDKGEPMFQLLNQARLQGVTPGYTAKLLSEFHKISTVQLTTEQPLVEPLSKRELQVLQLVVAGKSNQQIADELVIALGTVKRHIYNIFGKLGVRSRTQCVRQARELHLLQ